MGLAAGSVALLELGRRAIQTGDDMAKLSTRLGAPVENLSRLAFAAERTGVGTKTLETSMQRLARRIAEVATTGRGEALPALNALGLSAEKLNQLTVDKQFLAIADAMEGVKNPGEKVALTMKLMDTEGVKLLQTFAGGSKSISDLADQSDRLGNTISTSTAKQAERLKDAFTNLQASANGVGQELVKNLGPEITKIANLLTDVLPRATELASQAFIGLKAGVEGVAATVAFGAGKLAQGVQSALDTLVPGAFANVLTEDADKSLAVSRKLFAQMEKTYREGMANIESTLSEAPGSLREIIPSRIDVSGTNKSSADKTKESGDAKRYAEETGKLISLQEERFARLNQAALQAQGRTREVESNRFTEELAEIQALEDRLRQRLGTEFTLQAEFNKAREDAKRVHEANITSIEEDESEKRRRVKESELKVIEGFFSTAGTLAKDSSKAQRVLFAVEKGFALARALMALQVAKAQANASAPFPQNLLAIAKVVTLGLGAISSIRGISARASGGPVVAGRPYLVGEKGPELIIPKNDGTVLPNGMGIGSGGLIVNLYESNDRAGSVEQDGNQLNIFVDRITSDLVNQIRSGRGIGQEIAQAYNVQRRGVA